MAAATERLKRKTVRAAPEERRRRNRAVKAGGMVVKEGRASFFQVDRDNVLTGVDQETPVIVI